MERAEYEYVDSAKAAYESKRRRALRDYMAAAAAVSDDPALQAALIQAAALYDVRSAIYDTE